MQSNVFRQLIKDSRYIFLIIATLLTIVSLFITYNIHELLISLEKAILLAVPFAFAWVIIAWILTDQSILRRPFPYALIFIAIFIEKIYWAIFYLLFPPVYEGVTNLSDSMALGTGGSSPLYYSLNWLNLVESAYWVFVVLEFIVMFIVLTTLWYLARPRDFSKINYKRVIAVLFASFIMTVPLWIFRAIGYFGGNELLYDIVRNIEFSWHTLIFNNIFIAIAMLIFAVAITNIKSISKYVLFALIFIFYLVPSLPFYNFVYWSFSSEFAKLSAYFVLISISYFVIYLSLLLLVKTKYIEQ